MAPRSDPCSICLETMCRGESVLQLACDHHFHFRCISAWLGRSASCPMCKAAVVLPLGAGGARVHAHTRRPKIDADHAHRPPRTHTMMFPACSIIG